MPRIVMSGDTGGAHKLSVDASGRLTINGTIVGTQT